MMASSFNPSILGNVGGLRHVGQNTNRNVDPTFLFDVCAHHRHILHRLVTIHDRRTERSRYVDYAVASSAYKLFVGFLSSMLRGRMRSTHMNNSIGQNVVWRSAYCHSLSRPVSSFVVHHKVSGSNNSRTV